MGCKGLINMLPRYFIHPPQPLAVKPSQPSASYLIPTVDHSHPRSEIVHRIRDPSRTWGFSQVLYHGIPASGLDSVISIVRSFNKLPTKLKSQHYVRSFTHGVSFSTNFHMYQSKASTWRDTLQMRLGPHPRNVDRIPEVCRREVVEWSGHVRRVGEVLMGLLSEWLGLEKGRLEEMTCLDGRHMVAHYNP